MKKTTIDAWCDWCGQPLTHQGLHPNGVWALWKHTATVPHCSTPTPRYCDCPNDRYAIEGEHYCEPCLLTHE